MQPFKTVMLKFKKKILEKHTQISHVKADIFLVAKLLYKATL